MRFHSLAVAAGFSAATLLLTVPVRADEGEYRHGRVYHVEPGVTLHRASEVGAEEALANVPFLPGDRVWTDGSGRAEFQFPEGTVVRVDSRSKLDYAGHEEDRGERIVLRLWSGSLIVRLRSGEASQFVIETPAGAVELLDRAMVRVDVESGETRISTYRGEASFDDGRSRVRLAAGERTFARWGGEAAPPESFDVEPEDDFASWDDAREAEERQVARSSEYLPAELDPYAGELERNGSWRYEAAVGYVWTPRVASGWSPYTSGQWSWTPYGWTWVPYETWGWAPSHYGRWGFSASFGWYWSPASVWGPAWVSWGVGGGYVSWCPLGFRDRPVFPWHGSFNRGFAVPRGRGGHGGWNVVREGDFGLADVARRRVPTLGVDPRSIRVADSAALRPTRDARALQASTGRVRAISRRPTPGDFVRELAVDNRTTIPAPWRSREQARAAGEARGSREPSATARPRTSARPEPVEPQDRAQGASRRQRAVPWYAPRDGSATDDPGRGQVYGRSAARREAEANRAAAESRGSREPARPTTEPRAASPIGSLFERRERDADTGRPRSEGARSRAERREPPRVRERDGGQRLRARPEESAQRPQATRAERPAREAARSEPSQAPRGESQARPRSGGDGGSRGAASRGGDRAGARSARPSRPRD